MPYRSSSLSTVRRPHAPDRCPAEDWLSSHDLLFGSGSASVHRLVRKGRARPCRCDAACAPAKAPITVTGLGVCAEGTVASSHVIHFSLSKFTIVGVGGVHHTGSSS